MEELIPPLGPPAGWPWALGVPLAIGLAAWSLRAVRRSAFLAGVPLGILVARLGGLSGFAVLLAFFLLGTILTRLGYTVKEARGVAEPMGGRRGASHVAANCAAGLLLLLIRDIAVRLGASPAGDAVGLLWAAFVGSFAAAASDTSSSEIGQLLGRHPVSPRTLRPVPVGTEGAVSVEGLLAGLAAAILIGGLAFAVRLVDGPGWVAVALAGFLGNVLESLTGSWGRRTFPHGWLNFANTAVGAALAAAGAALF
jgi:uncharacterized protein (TIGR00297 family)